MDKERIKLIKRLSFMLIIFVNAILIYVFDVFLLKYQLSKRAKYLPEMTKVEFPNLKFDPDSVSNYGKDLKEGSMVSEVIFEHRNHHYNEDFIYESNGDNIFWIFGDSWGGGISLHEKSNNTIRKTLENEIDKKIKSLRIISSGSWSPTLMNLALRKRISETNNVPDKVVFFIDQTDIGDEICRYRPFVFRDNKNRLVGVAINPYDNMIGRKDIIHLMYGNHKSGIVLTLQKVIDRIVRVNMLTPGITSCTMPDIVPYQLGKEISPNGTPISDYIEYFNISLNELITEAKAFNNNVKILFVTHFWAQHYLPSNHKNYFPNNINNIVSTKADKDENIFHMHIDLDDYEGKNIKEIFDYPKDWASHPKNYQTLSKKIAEKLISIGNL